MPAFRLQTAPLIAAALAAAPSPVLGWNPTCTGEFTCSVIRSNDRDLWDYGDNDEPRCKFGHIEEDGTCERSCDGPRTAPCRCQTRLEAEWSIESGAKSSLFVCLAIIVVGLTTTMCTGLCLTRVSGAERSRAAREATRQAAREAEPRPAAEVQEEGEAAAAEPVAGADVEAGTSQDDGAPVAGVAAEGEQLPDSPSSANSGVLPSRLEEMLSNSKRVAEENPKKVQLMRWFFPCLALGFASWGAYELLTKQDQYEGQFYDHLETFLGIVAVLAVFLSVVLLLCSSIDNNPVVCLIRTLMVAYLIVPLIGLAGLVWSLLRMMRPEGIYHACERPHCIFDVC